MERKHKGDQVTGLGIVFPTSVGASGVCQGLGELCEMCPFYGVSALQSVRFIKFFFLRTITQFIFYQNTFDQKPSLGFEARTIKNNKNYLRILRLGYCFCHSYKKYCVYYMML